MQHRKVLIKHSRVAGETARETVWCDFWGTPCLWRTSCKHHSRIWTYSRGTWHVYSEDPCEQKYGHKRCSKTYWDWCERRCVWSDYPGANTDASRFHTQIFPRRHDSADGNAGNASGQTSCHMHSKLSGSWLDLVVHRGEHLNPFGTRRFACKKCRRTSRLGLWWVDPGQQVDFGTEFLGFPWQNSDLSWCGRGTNSSCRCCHFWIGNRCYYCCRSWWIVWSINSKPPRDRKWVVLGSGKDTNSLT